MSAFRFLTAGESHGPALGVTVEGVPAGLALTADELAVDLARLVSAAMAAARARRSNRIARRSSAAFGTG